MYIFENVYLHWICSANNLGNICQLNIYMLVLDITCQQLGDECKLEGFCVPFGHRVGECTFLKMYICIGYMLPTIKGRPKDLDVRKTWTSERPGRPKDLDVRGPGCPGTWKSERPGCPKDLDVRGPGCPGTWMSERPECPKDLDVRGPGCPGT